MTQNDMTIVVGLTWYTLRVLMGHVNNWLEGRASELRLLMWLFRGFEGLLPVALEEEEAKRIIGDEELLSNMVDTLNFSTIFINRHLTNLEGANFIVKFNGVSILVIVKNILEIIAQSLCVTRSGNNLFLKRITQRPKYLHLDEIIELTPFRVSTSSVGFDMIFKTDTPNVNERKRTPRVVVMVFKFQFNRDLVRDDKGYEFISKGDAIVDSFKRCCTSDAFDVGYRVLILHRSSINNSESLSNKFRRFYFILKFDISGLLHHVVTSIADRIGGTLLGMLKGMSLSLREGGGGGGVVSSTAIGAKF
nr:hypothetical protein [Tanacetum cinerariifolium]